MAIVVVREVDDYGAITHDDEELVVPLTVLDHHPTITTKHSSSSRTPSWTTKKLLMCAGMIGMTGAVASSALLIFSILEFSNQDSTASSFLLHTSVGADDSKCIPAEGPWPAGALSSAGNEDHDAPFITCFSFEWGKNYCWSHAYYANDFWQSCTPKGFTPGDPSVGWRVATGNDNDEFNYAVCGLGCQEFSAGMPVPKDAAAVFAATTVAEDAETVAAANAAANAAAIAKDAAALAKDAEAAAVAAEEKQEAEAKK